MTIALAYQPLMAFLLASIRIIAWIALVPPFSNKVFPAMAKLTLALGLAFAITPTIPTGVPTDTGSLVLTAVTQVFIGAAMGFVTYLLFTAVSSAGALIDTFGGFALAQGFDPMSMTNNSVFGKFHQMLAIMLFFTSGAYLLLFGGLMRTFDFLPIGTAPEVSGMSGIFTTAFGMFFTVAIQMALPMIAVLFIVDLGLAILTKVAPQLNAITFMFPVKVGLTLLLLGLSLPVLPVAMEHLMSLAGEAMAALAGAG